MLTSIALQDKTKSLMILFVILAIFLISIVALNVFSGNLPGLENQNKIIQINSDAEVTWGMTSFTITTWD